MAVDEMYKFVFGLVTIRVDVGPWIDLNGSDANAAWRRICALSEFAAERVAGSSCTQKKVDRASRELSIDV